MTGCALCAETGQSEARIQVLDDLYPSSPEHRLIVPKRHVARVADLTHIEMHGLWIEAWQAAEGEADGYTIGINDGEAAGQTVPHVHLHVIPRRHGDVPDPRGGIRWVLPETAPYWLAAHAPRQEPRGPYVASEGGAMSLRNGEPNEVAVRSAEPGRARSPIPVDTSGMTDDERAAAYSYAEMIGATLDDKAAGRVASWPDNCTCDDNEALLRDGHRSDCPYLDGPKGRVPTPHDDGCECIDLRDDCAGAPGSPTPPPPPKSGRVPTCVVHECGQPAAFLLTWPDREPRHYCWPCLRGKYHRHPWDSATQTPLPVSAPARTTTAPPSASGT